MSQVTHYICPNCGKEVAIGPRGCPTCTDPAEAKRAWEHSEIYDGLDLPEDSDFDQIEYHPYEEESWRPSFGWGWWLVALLLVFVIMIVYAI